MPAYCCRPRRSGIRRAVVTALTTAGYDVAAFMSTMRATEALEAAQHIEVLINARLISNGSTKRRCTGTNGAGEAGRRQGVVHRATRDTRTHSWRG
jgi:hypothetical protein